MLHTESIKIAPKNLYDITVYPVMQLFVPLQCAPRGRMDQTVSTGVPVRMGQSVTTLQESVYVDRAGRV